MGLYRRKDSPYWWAWIERRRGLKPILESTKIVADPSTPEQRKLNRQLAERLYYQRLSELASTDHHLDPKPTISFAAHALWYETHVVPSHGSRIRERSVLKQLRAWFGATALQLIDRAAVLEWRSARLQIVRPSTVDRELDVLKSLMAAAVPKYLEASPIAGLKRHRETVQSKKRRPRILTRDEEVRLLKITTDPHERALLLVAIDTLMRLSDVTSLRRDRDYGGSIHVEAPKIEPYDVPVSSRLRKALDALPKDGPQYFPNRWSTKGGGISRNTVWRIFKRLCEAAEIPVGRKARGLTFHSLRHTGTTRLLEAGVNPLAVMEIGGWTELRQLVRYGRASDDTKRQGVELIGPPAPPRLRSKRTPKKQARKRRR